MRRGTALNHPDHDAGRPDNPGNYEPHSNLVAVYHETMLLDLDAGPIADEK